MTPGSTPPAMRGVAEELRFFLRTGLYAAVIAAVYWFASYDPVHDTYDWAGTALLVAAALAGIAVAAVMGAFARRALHGRPGSTLAVLGRWLGLSDPGGAADEAPLATGLDPIPRSSVWPLMGGLAAAFIGLGLVYGPWLWLPGIALLGWTAWRWVTQLRSAP
jgi:hypothetical protein